MKAARLENERLSAELAVALQRVQAKRKTSTAAAAHVRSEIDAQCEERVREERARGEQEMVMLREAAANDFATAQAHHAAEIESLLVERQALPHARQMDSCAAAHGLRSCMCTARSARRAAPRVLLY